MIESSYWKAELKRQASKIRQLQRCRRWTEKHVVMIEREIMIAFFCVRSLIERHKITDALTNSKVPAIIYPIRPGKKATLLNRWDIDEVYQLDKPEKKGVSLSFLSNQVIHSYVITAQRLDSRDFTSLLVCSDYERNKQLFEVQISDIRKVMINVSNNYPNSVRFRYDSKTADYRVTTKIDQTLGADRTILNVESRIP